MSTRLAGPVRLAETYERPLGVPPSLRSWFAAAGHIPIQLRQPDALTHIPTAATTVILRRQAPDHQDVMVIGPRTRASYHAAKAPASCLRLRIAPGAVRPLLGVAAAEMTDRIVPLAEFPGPLAEFTDRILHAAADGVLPLLEHQLPQRISDDPADRSRRALLSDAATLVADRIGVSEVAARLAVSERQLRNLFTSGIGLSPKHFARISRVRRLLSGPDAALLADLAADEGFYDQSHMAADFRSLMGVAPSRFFEGRLPAPVPCTAHPRG
ncbi:helix-turn-helix domain-containing protein [Nocardia sp. alder85J]|uniref:helix-turn-helix domain-containing protein n=1 Tax=Nocardia sp. alder85J TaxID=2862949 RepID=UPI001CD7CB7C|nr:helix-turn-helix domain-containing protein [Nocardia sp. alder85J]MCX4091204.1 helix-turn-helix domain-containing protein [Nocardia sp. alder85J]